MTKKGQKKESLWEDQNNALRDPVELFAGTYQTSGIHPDSLKYKIKGAFSDVINEKGITLLVSREYEHLVMALSITDNQLNQTFFHLPHPSGLVVDRERNSLYVAATRNPNQIIEFKPATTFIERIEDQVDVSNDTNSFMPSRAKFFSGSHYFHELAIINNELYGNAVGMNGILKIDFGSSDNGELCWWPKCIENEGGPNLTSNFIQLNSIAAGNTIEESFFTASGDTVSSRRPGHRNYPTDKRGVVFSGKTREVIARGLTRPHSAKLINGKVWLDNSGYGEVGYVENEKFVPVIKLPGWTRGLCHVDGVLFVGVSRILPRFKNYAPGLPGSNYLCSVFAIDRIDSGISGGFIFNNARPSSSKEKSSFYRYKF